MTRLTGLREQLIAYGEKRGLARVSVNDLIIKAAGIALRSFPAVNASLEGGEVVEYADVNVGFAVALDDGLVVPVVASADQNRSSTSPRRPGILERKPAERAWVPKTTATAPSPSPISECSAWTSSLPSSTRRKRPF